MNKIITVLISLVAIVSFQVAPVFAQSKDAVCAGVGSVTGTGNCTTSTGAPTVENGITTVVNILSWVVGLVSVIMIILGGFRYVTSSGDSGKVSSAQQTIIYAIVGLIIVALAQIIVRFVLKKTV